MRSSRRFRWTRWAAGFFGLAAGCATGPVPQLANLNPWLTREWREDAKFGPTPQARRDELAQLRRRAGRMSEQEATQVAAELVALMRADPNPLMRAEYTQVLAELTSPVAEEGLRLASTDSNGDVRIAAIRAWNARGGEEALRVIAEAVGSDTDLDVRLEATSALARFDEEQAVRALSVALDDSNVALQFRAMQSLRNATGRDYGNDVKAWRTFCQGNEPDYRPPSVVARLRNLF